MSGALERFAKEAGLVSGGHGPDLQQLADQQHEESLALLERDWIDEPDWFSPEMTATLGPIMGGDVVIVGARPGGGKTTLLTEQTLHLIANGHSVVYAGMEMPAPRLKLQLAAVLAGVDVPSVMRGHWHKIPTGGKSKVLEQLRYLQSLADRLVFVPDERLSVAKLMDWCAFAEKHEFGTVIVDHIHQMDWGDPTELTSKMTEGLRQMNAAAKRHQIRLLLGAQLKRGQYDPLEDYMVPPQSAIKQSGAAEEVADVIVLLHRALRADATEGDLQLVRRGQRQVHEVADDGTLIAHVAKHRLDGTVRDTDVRLYVGRNRLFDSIAARDQFIFTGATL